MTCARRGCDNPIPPRKPGQPGRPQLFCCPNCAKRDVDDRHRATCIDCGNQLGARSGWSQPNHNNLRCRDCEFAARRARGRERLERVAEMFNAGKSMREIADALGYGPNSMPPEVTQARRLGLMGYRNSRPSVTSAAADKTPGNQSDPGDAPTPRGHGSQEGGS